MRTPVSSRRARALATPRVMALVRVETLAGLLAKLTGLDHAQQQRRRGVVRVLELVVHGVGDQLHGVEADQVGKPQWTHRMRQSRNDGGVDVLDRSDT